MRFRCDRDTLVEALTAASRAVSSRGGPLQVLSGLRLSLVGGQLEVTGSDLDLTISVTVPVDGDTDGKTIIPAKLAVDIVRSLDDGRVDIATENGQATISLGRSDFTVQLMAAEEWPQLSEPSGEVFTVAASELADGLGQVVKAASKDDSRPILTGVLLAAEGTGLRMVSTDSYRLAMRDLPGTSVLAEGKHVLVPSRALAEVSRMIAGQSEITVTLGEHDVSFTTSFGRLTTRLIEGEFPNYRGLIPTSQPNRLVVSRAALIDAVRRVRLMAREATPVRLTLSSDTLALRATTQDVGEAHEELDAKYEGAEMTVAFNPEYLLDGLEVTPGDEVTLETVDALKPALLRSGDTPDFLYLLMPVRVS